MVKIRPFKAVRPNQEDAAEIASLPYDVVDFEEAYQYGKENEKSYLHIDRSEIDLSRTISPYADEVYQKAAENLSGFLEKGWLIKDQKPGYYLYELTMDGKEQTGIVACTSVQEYLDGIIKKHEFTRPEKEIDRIRHSDVTDANTSPIFLTYRNQQKIADFVSGFKKAHAPIIDFTSFYNVTHRVWHVKDAEPNQEITRLFAENVPSLYIADGHHRTESAVKVSEKRLETYPDASEDAEFRYFLSVLFPDNALRIFDYNRVVQAKIGKKEWDSIQKSFDIEPRDEAYFKPDRKGTFGLYTGGKWYKLAIKDFLVGNDPVKSLDASLLQEYLLAPVLGIKDPRTAKNISFVGGIRGIKELTDLEDKQGVKEEGAAFSLYPTTMEQLLAVADSGKVMPPKSTWFEPKLLSGLFVHDLESGQ